MRQLKITSSITNREDLSLDKYLQEIGHEELLTVDEEVELAQRIKKVTGRHLNASQRQTSDSLSQSLNSIRTRVSVFLTLSMKGISDS